MRNILFIILVSIFVSGCGEKFVSEEIFISVDKDPFFTNMNGNSLYYFNMKNKSKYAVYDPKYIPGLNQTVYIYKKKFTPFGDYEIVGFKK